jgi:hypothetical protein
MKSIRIRFNYNTVQLSEQGVVGSSKSVCGAQVQVMLKSGKKEWFDFLGFEEVGAHFLEESTTQLVKVANVSAYYADDFSKPVFFDDDVYLVGVYQHRPSGVYVAIRDNKPISFHIPKPTQITRHENNVVSLQRWKKIKETQSLLA